MKTLFIFCKFLIRIHFPIISCWIFFSSYNAGFLSSKTSDIHAAFIQMVVHNSNKNSANSANKTGSGMKFPLPIPCNKTAKLRCVAGSSSILWTKPPQWPLPKHSPNSKTLSERTNWHLIPFFTGGNYNGHIHGNVHGNVHGNIHGNIHSNVHGGVHGDNSALNWIGSTFLSLSILQLGLFLLLVLVMEMEMAITMATSMAISTATSTAMSMAVSMVMAMVTIQLSFGLVPLFSLFQ